MILLYILLRKETYINSRFIAIIAFLYSIIFGINGIIVLFKGIIQFLEDKNDVIKKNDEMSNFYIITDRFFKDGGILIDKNSGEEFKMIVPLHSITPRFPDDVADRKIRLFPFCSQEYEFSIYYRQTFNIQVYLDKNGKRIDLCVKNLGNEFEKRFISGAILLFFGIFLTFSTIIINIKCMVNSLVDTNIHLGSVITSIFGVITLSTGAFFTTNSLNYFLDNVNLTKEEKIKAGLPEPQLNYQIGIGLTLLILHYVGNILIMIFGAILRDKELKKIRQRALEMDNKECEKIGESVRKRKMSSKSL